MFLPCTFDRGKQRQGNRKWHEKNLDLHNVRPAQGFRGERGIQNVKSSLIAWPRTLGLGGEKVSSRHPENPRTPQWNCKQPSSAESLEGVQTNGLFQPPIAASSQRRISQGNARRRGKKRNSDNQGGWTVFPANKSESDWGF